MDPTVQAWMELAFRWTHVVAGIMWIGHLYFFNFVNAQLAKTYDADSKKKVIPELMPRALYWFRWGAAYTWITGILLAGLVYYMQRAVFLLPENTMGTGAAVGIAVGAMVVGFGLYDVMWNALAKQEMVGTIVSLVLVAGLAYGLSLVFTGRAVFIHVGAVFGTIMAANVWMRIWPAQRKIITAIKAGTAPDAAIAARAGLRSKHNTYMSVPLVLMMISNHYPTVYGSSMAWAILVGIIALGWLVTKGLYGKSGGPAPAQYAVDAAKPAESKA